MVGIYICYLTFTYKTALLLALKLVFLLTAFVSTLYWLVLFVKVSLYKEPTSYAKKERPSIIISAKNAAHHLAISLPKLLNQSFQELIVANDYSEDKTQEVLETLKGNNPLLKSFVPAEDKPGKKHALTEGILQASSENILLTDADCQPASTKWAEIMNAHLIGKFGLVLGYGPLIKENNFINLFSRFETTLTAVQYFGYALFKIPYMGVGRNIAFSKALFTKVGGYTSHLDIPSGDDDLFVQSARKMADISVCLNKESFMYSRSESTLSNYIRQKRRHVATSSRYSIMHKLLLSINPFCHILLFASAIFLLLKGYIFFVLSICFTRWISLIVFGYLPFTKLDSKDLLLLFPILELCFFCYYLFFGLDMLRPKKPTW